MQGTEPIRLVVGGSILSPSDESDWPKSLWRFLVDDDDIPSNEGDFPVDVDVALVEWVEKVSVTRCEGGEEGRRCWVGGDGPVFGSTHTTATSSVLAGELNSCKELLQMEPHNKCELGVQ